MATNKEVLQKLYKIAQNQQKIIRKLAQEMNAVPAATVNAAQFQPVVNLLARMAKVTSEVKVAYVNSAPGLSLTIGVQSADSAAADKLNEAVGRATAAVLAQLTKAAGQQVVNVTFNQS